MEKVDILVYNGIIVTMNRERRVINNGYVAVRDGIVVDVGVGDAFGKYYAEEKIDAKRGIVTPGFMCAHTHFYGLLITGSPWLAKIEPPTDFQQNLQRIWWALDVFITHEEAYASALAGSILFAKTGVTSFFDNISAPNAIDGILDYVEKGVNEVGLRGFVSFEATQRRSIEEGYRGLAENERFIKKNNFNPTMLVKGAIYLHASFTVSNDLFLKARELANRYRCLVAIHTAEGLVDVYHNLERYGLRPVERMHRLGFLGSDVILVHAVHLTRDEIAIVAKTGAHVAHNPLSNMLNAVGVANIPEMIKAGINVGLGNDGYIFDQFENMRATYLVHKLWNRDPRIITPLEVVEMSTVNVARMFHLGEQLGSLEPGKRADIVVIRPEGATTPVNDKTVYSHIVNSVSSKDVKHVIVDGKFVLKDGKVTRLDEEKAMEYVREIVEKLWDRLVEKGSYQLDYLKL